MLQSLEKNLPHGVPGEVDDLGHTMLIQLNVNGALSDDQIQITVDGKYVKAQLTDRHVNIELPLQFGLHQLVIESRTKQRFEIQKASIDHCDLRKLFYLAWSDTADGQRLQPCNELWEPGQRWTLPFGYPVSDWLAKVERKFAYGILGSDLYRDYWIWYPESIELDSKNPQIIKDFFSYNFDFTAVSKKNWTYDHIPFIKYTDNIDPDLIVLAHKELQANADIINLLNKNPEQQKYNTEEFGYTKEQQWQVLLLHREASKGLPAINSRYRDKFPACWTLIDSLGIPYWYAFIGIMPPWSIVYPHVDDSTMDENQYQSYRGCTQLYVPIYGPDHSYLKIANAGTVDNKSGAMIINNDNFTHAAVNNSAEYRYMLALRTSHDQISKFAVTC